MTSPVLHGYPDFQRQSAESDISVLYLDTIVINGARTDGPLFVGGMQSLYVACTGSVTRTRVSFNFFLDKALTQPVDTDAIVVTAGGFYTGPVTVFGPYLQVVTEGSVYPNTVTVKILMAPGVQAATGPNGSAGELLHGNPTNVLATTTTTVLALPTWRGMAMCYAELPAVASEFNLEAVQFSGAARLLYRLVGNGLREMAQIALPTDIIRVRLVNPSGAAQDFRYAVNGIRLAG